MIIPIVILKKIGYILHKVNYSVWLGQGWFISCKYRRRTMVTDKRLTNDFSGVAYSIIHN